MVFMLFRKKIQRACAYCAYGTNLEGTMILCAKKGVRLDDVPCRKFKYDPCKRVPAKAKALDFSKYDEKDYSL